MVAKDAGAAGRDAAKAVGAGGGGAYARGMRDPRSVRAAVVAAAVAGVALLGAAGVVVVALGGAARAAGAEIREAMAAEKPLERRIGERSYPSVFQAWSAADNLKGEDPLATIARHDLYFSGPGAFGLRWDAPHEGLGTDFTPESVDRGHEMRGRLLALNPNLVLLAEIRYRDAARGFLPDGHTWWARRDGKPVAGWEEGGYFVLDFGNPEYRRHVAAQCRAAVESGVVDGVLLDWWTEDDDRVALAKAVREAIGEKALLLVNANDRQTPRSAPYVNGFFMECTRSRTAEDWRRIAETLAWAEKNLRPPRTNCLETWFHASRQDLGLMRATATLSLTHSDGYCLFSDPNDLPKPDHLHDWYGFWDRRLGRPLGPGRRRPDGATEREFENGTVVYNPMDGAPVTVTFDAPRASAATGETARQHPVPPADGDLFLKAKGDAAP